MTLTPIEATIEDKVAVLTEILLDWKARAEAAEHERDRYSGMHLQEAQQWKARAEAAEARVAYLESLMGGRASTILLGASHEP